MKDLTVHYGSTRGALCSAPSGSLALSTSLKLVDCDDCLDIHKRNDPDYDPAPYCIHCGPKSACKCQPHPSND